MNKNTVMGHRHQRGSVLLVVVGLSVLLLTSFVVVMRIVRVDAQVGAQVEREAQARIMLPAALSFILESARLGQHSDGETFGWTDVRDGSWGPKVDLSDTITSGTWPGPNSHYRADMEVMTRAPFATEGRSVYNPIQLDPSYMREYTLTNDPINSQLGKILQPSYDSSNPPTDPATDLGYIPYEKENLPVPVPGEPDPEWFSNSLWLVEGGPHEPPVLTSEGILYHWNRVWTAMAIGYYNGSSEFHYNLLPQAESNTRADFVAGDATPLPGSQNRAWFRVYREPADMHDGTPNNTSVGDGEDYFDRVPIQGENVFIITCGAGPTKGYKDWSEIPSGEQDLFRSPEFFDMLRSRERIIWYRCEWSPSTGNNADARMALLPGGLNTSKTDNYEINGHLSAISTLTNTQWGNAIGMFRETNGTWLPQSLNVTGSILWIQRLDKEPPQW